MWNPRIWCGKNPRKLRKIQLQQHFDGKLQHRTYINRNGPPFRKLKSALFADKSGILLNEEFHIDWYKRR